MAFIGNTLQPYHRLIHQLGKFSNNFSICYLTNSTHQIVRLNYGAECTVVTFYHQLVNVNSLAQICKK